MSQWNIAAKSKDDQDKVNVDLAASGVAYKERLNQPVIAEQVAREQPEHLRDYFMERVRYYREKASSSPRYPIRAIWKWQSRTPRNSHFLVYAHFAFIPGKGDNYLVSLDN